MLDAVTLTLIAEAFAGKVCCECGGPAGRFVRQGRSGQRFYCHACIDADLRRLQGRHWTPPLASCRHQTRHVSACRSKKGKN